MNTFYFLVVLLGSAPPIAGMADIGLVMESRLRFATMIDCQLTRPTLVEHWTQNQSLIVASLTECKKQDHTSKPI